VICTPVRRKGPLGGIDGGAALVREKVQSIFVGGRRL